MESLSWKRYDDKYKLSSVLTEAARACVDAHTARPEEYLAAYFTKKYTVDEIRNVSLHAAYLPSGTQVLRLTLHLLNGMEAESMAVFLPLHETADAGNTAAQSVDKLTVVEEVLKKNYFPRLLQCGACKQVEFDEVLRRTHSLTDVIDVGSSVLYGLSSVAAAAAARCLSTPLFMYVRQSIAPINDGEMFAMPQPCITFFGSENTCGGRLALRDVFLIPSMPRGLVCGNVVEKIFAAFHHFSRVHSAGRRSDGSLLFDAFDNLTDAVTLAEDALRAVGLVPVEDVCIGLRIAANAISDSNNSNAVSSTAAAAAVSSGNASAGKDRDHHAEVMYALFPGDGDVTGAQVAEYVREQLQNRTDFVIYIEDTHSDRDAAGLRRLRARLGDSVTVSGRELYSCGGYKKVQQGLSELWTSNFVIEPDVVGNLSDVYDIVRTVKEHEGCGVSIATQDLVANATMAAHLAVGMGARFICMGGLLSVSQCEVLSHLLCIQNELDNARTLRREAPKIPFLELPEAPNDIVPEIKRRMDKKKRKK